MFYVRSLQTLGLLSTIILILSISSSVVAEENIQKPQDPQGTKKGSSDLVHPPTSLSGDQLSLQGQSIQLPCNGSALLDHQGVAYISCGAKGVLIVGLDDQGSPQINVQHNFGGVVTGFFVVEGEVWAKIARVEARPLTSITSMGGRVHIQSKSPSPESEVNSSSTTQSTRSSPKVGKVLSLRPDAVVVSLGKLDGVKPGSYIELFTSFDEDLGEGEQTSRDQMLAIGVVKVAGKHRSVVQLGLGESAPIESQARITSKRPTLNKNMPPRSSGYWEMTANFRPFLALGSLGFGTITDGSIGYRGEEGLHMMILVEPLGVALAEEGNIISSAAALVAGYDTQMFEVGLGLGMAAINDELYDSPILSVDESSRAFESEPPTFDRVRSGLSIMQTVRLGALDGLHLNAHNMFIVHEGEFMFGGTNIRAQLPLSQKTWLVARGGGGISGYGYGEIALRVLIRGNGDRGSLFLTPSLGGGGVFGETETDTPVDQCYSYVEDGKCIDNVSYSGPMVGIGIEWRR